MHQARLPAGSPCVLLSRYHASTDLILPIDAREKQMLDSIDGLRSIAAIAARAGAALPSARGFFEKLYWYDQVVFDASRAK